MSSAKAEREAVPERTSRGTDGSSFTQKPISSVGAMVRSRPLTHLHPEPADASQERTINILHGSVQIEKLAAYRRSRLDAGERLFVRLAACGTED